MPETEWEFVLPVPSSSPRAAGAASASSNQDSGSPPRVPEEPSQVPSSAVSIEQIYQDALEQAQELLLEVDPRFQDATKIDLEELTNLCEDMAQKAVAQELRARSSSKTDESTPQGQPVPHIKASRRPRAAEDPTSTKEPEPEEGPTETEWGHRWRYLVWKVRSNKRWSSRSMMFQYSRRMPKSIDGAARGMGKHPGRWGWREIAAEW